MLGIKYFKADSSTYVIQSINGKVKKKGRGLSFFYQPSLSSIITVPISSQECPYIFNVQTMDFQQVVIQGQLVFQITDPGKTTAMLNYSLSKQGLSYVSDDPGKLTDRINRLVQVIIQCKVQSISLKDVLTLGDSLVELLAQRLSSHDELIELGIEVKSVSMSGINPSKEMGRALEAQTRELILKEADDAIYARRKSSVEQERMVKEAELQTELSIQQKEQEIEEKRIENKRSLIRAEYATAQEKLANNIQLESQREGLVEKTALNKKREADMDSYTLAENIKAFKLLPVENLKAMALANMDADQLMAMAFDSLSQNSAKIGELNISPDFLSSFRKIVKT